MTGLAGHGAVHSHATPIAGVFSHGKSHLSNSINGMLNIPPTKNVMTGDTVLPTLNAFKTLLIKICDIWIYMGVCKSPEPFQMVFPEAIVSALASQLDQKIHMSEEREKEREKEKE